MDGAVNMETWIGVINTGGLVALLGALVFMFMRGDIISRNVYERLSVKLVEQALTRMTERVCQRLERMEAAQATSITNAVKQIAETEHSKTRRQMGERWAGRAADGGTDEGGGR